MNSFIIISLKNKISPATETLHLVIKRGSSKLLAVKHGISDIQAITKSQKRQFRHQNCAVISRHFKAVETFLRSGTDCDSVLKCQCPVENQDWVGALKCQCPVESLTADCSESSRKSTNHIACVLYNLTEPLALPFNGPFPFPTRFLSNKVFSSSLSSSDSVNVKLCAKYLPEIKKRSLNDLSNKTGELQGQI